VTGARVRLLAPLRVREFALLWWGQSVSLAGNGIFNVALTWEALTVGGGGRALALVLVARFLPSTALLLVGGVVSDRLSRRTTMLVSDGVQAVALAVLAALTLADQLRLWHLVVVAAVAGGASGFFLPASTALVPEVVPPDLLVAANSLNTASRLTTARLVGPVTGGLLVAAGGAGAAFGVDALTFVVSAGTLAALRVPARTAAREGGPSLRAELREGVAYCVTRRWLAVSLLAFAVVNLCVSAPLAVLVPLYVKEQLHQGAGTLGALFAAEGVGGAIAAIGAAELRPPRRYVVATHVTFGLAGLLMVAMAVSRSIWVAGALLAVVGLLLEVGNVYWTTAEQRHVPNALLGRVASVDWLMSGSLIPVGMALVGAVAAIVGVAPVFAVGGGVTALTGLVTGTYLRTRDPGYGAAAPET
jgi:MFS family permease